jgi:hypothetical protein
MESKQTIVIDGESEQVQPLPQKKEKRELTKATFTLKYALLLALIYWLLGIAYGILFVGLEVVSFCLVLLTGIFVKEIYRDISKQLSHLHTSNALALPFTVLSLIPPVVGAVAVLIFVLASKPNPTS